ncbi:hypothetical protein VP01_2313g4, partial [Puccinia sorghi]
MGVKVMYFSSIISTQAVLKAAITTAFIMMFDSENENDSDLEDYFSFCKHQYERQYLTARGTTTRFHPQYNLSAIQSLSKFWSQQIFRMSWPCFLNLLHLIEPDPIFYNQSQNPQQDVSIQLDVATCCLGSNGNGAAVLRLKNLSELDMEQSTCILHESHQSNLQHAITIGIMANTRRTSRTISGHARRRLSWLY